MSTLASERPWDRYLYALAHWYALLIALLICADITHHFVDSLLTRIVAVTLLLVTATAMVGEIHHERRLCPACAEAFPLNPAEQANGKRKTALRAFHLVADRGRWFIYSAQITTVVVSFWVWWAFSAMWFVFLMLAWGGYWHRMLGPWCPFCRGGGGGGPHECAPDPVPDPGIPASR